MKKEITSFKIVSSIEYIGRVLSIAEFEVEDKVHRTIFYRSSGSNINAKGTWFPISGLAGPGSVVRTGMHAGWIIKDYLYTTADSIQRCPSVGLSASQHADKNLRLTAFRDMDINYTLEDISNNYSEHYNDSTVLTSFHLEITPDEIKFVNEWMLAGLKKLHKDTDKIKVQELLDKEIAAQLSFL